ncbi:MAG: hypothetical protein P4L74_01530 [Candidatus Doudnabacteria bacterium]|nr:hypothetical protein [Candidatus Doudnabacteria bacterium]
MDNLSELRAQVFARQKTLAEIYRQSGNQSLADYADNWKISEPSEHTEVFFSYLKKFILRSGSDIPVGDVMSQLALHPLVSTIDHHGILNHPFFVNSNLIYSLRPNLKYLVCLSTAGVSLNNSSWPGCLLLTGTDGQTRRFSFFPDKIKTEAVLAAAGFGPGDVERVMAKILAADFLSPERKRRVSGLIEGVFENPRVFELKNFSEQAAFIAPALWSKIFPSAPRLLYVPLEELVVDIIVGDIAADSNHILHKLFFTPNGWDSIEKFFFGSMGAFSAGHKGSFLFWGLDTNRRRVRLVRQGQKLSVENFSATFFGNDVSRLLADGQIYPGSLACFLVLLYYGFTCLGGFNQVNWLTEIKERFLELLKERGELETFNRIAAVPTDNFAEGSLVLGADGSGKIYKPTGLDLFLLDDRDLYYKYAKLAEQITVAESIDSQLPEIYRVITPSALRKNNMLSVTENEILNQNGIAEKIKSAL